MKSDACTDVMTLIRDLIVQRGWDPELIADDADLFDSGVLDSLALVEILATIDERFVVGSDDELESLRSVNAIRAYVSTAPPR